IALAEMDTHPIAIAQHLHLDVPRLLDVLLTVDFRGAERGARLGLTSGERLRGAGVLADDSHAAPAPARRRLEDYGITGFVGDLERLRLVLEGQLAARHDRNPRLLGDHSRLRFVPHETNRLRTGTDEGQARGAADVGEGRVLGEKAVPGVD